MDTMKGLIFCLTFSILLSYFSVNGSAILLKPLNRGSLWRYLGNASYANELTVNRDDTELNCGGQNTLGRDLTGLCGACGDPVNGAREHEAGGIYATGHPTAIYNESTIINVTVNIINKKRGGFFEFYLCESDATTIVNEACFQTHPLKFAGTDNTRTSIRDVEGEVTFELQLPAGVTCQHCVMRMTWVTANEYRCDPTGLCGLGYWDQPTYVNCADISILTQGSPIPTGFEYPDYTSLYASVDANGGDTASTTAVPPTLSTDNIIIIGSTRRTTPSPFVSETTTEAPPTGSTDKLIVPVAPIINAGVGGGFAAAGGLGLLSPFLPLAGLGGFALWNRFKNRPAQYPQPLFFDAGSGPISYSAVPMLGAPTYVPSPQVIVEQRYIVPSKGQSYSSYGSSNTYSGYGKGNYGTTGYGSNYGNNAYNVGIVNSGYNGNNFGSSYSGSNNYGSSYGK